jgi:hypothetical protein
MQKHLTFSLALLTLLCTSAHAQLPSYLPADGLVAWWPFNGNANDESGNGNDGVVNGATLTEDRFGNGSRSYSFDGSQKIETSLTQITSMNAAMDFDFSVSVWIEANIAGENLYRSIVSKTNGISNRFAEFNLQIDNSNELDFFFGNGNSSEYALSYWPNNPVETNTWIHLAMIYQGGEVFFYRDGVYLNSATVSQRYLGEDPVVIGWYLNDDPSYTEGTFFLGKIDDLAIYNRALSSQEVQDLFAAPNETVDTGDGAAPLPQGIPYQAAARDAQGQVIADAPVNVRFSLHEGAVDGAVSYSETHALTTNGIGLFNTVFGNGTPEQSAFDSINWAATTKFLQVEIDLGDGYVDMGTTQLLSVPYAFRSDEAARIKNAGLPIFADNAAALAGGLVAGEMYRTATGDLKVVY